MFNKKIKTIIKVEGMSCNHCANKLITSLEELEEVSKVKVDLKSKEVTILSKEALDLERVKEKINALDYKYMGVK